MFWKTFRWIRYFCFFFLRKSGFSLNSAYIFTNFIIFYNNFSTFQSFFSRNFSNNIMNGNGLWMVKSWMVMGKPPLNSRSATVYLLSVWLWHRFSWILRKYNSTIGLLKWMARSTAILILLNLIIDFHMQTIEEIWFDFFLFRISLTNEYFCKWFFTWNSKYCLADEWLDRNHQIWLPRKSTVKVNQTMITTHTTTKVHKELLEELSQIKNFWCPR